MVPIAGLFGRWSQHETMIGLHDRHDFSAFDHQTRLALTQDLPELCGLPFFLDSDTTRLEPNHLCGKLSNS